MTIISGSLNNGMPLLDIYTGNKPLSDGLPIANSKQEQKNYPNIKQPSISQVPPAQKEDPTRPDQKTTDQSKSKEENNYANSISGVDQAFTPDELKLLEELKIADAKVRQHEMAHIAAGGKYITSGANFTLKKGPDGQNYAVAGEVRIDTSPIPGDPEATIQKMNQVKNAALAPSDPSPQDLKVASNAASEALKALSELMINQLKGRMNTDGQKAFENYKKAADSYEKINSIESSTMPPSFKIAV